MANFVPKKRPLEEEEEDENDSEWEYEYHPTETEDFYVTIDLSSASSRSKPKKTPDKSSNSNSVPSKIPVLESIPANATLGVNGQLENPDANTPNPSEGQTPEGNDTSELSTTAEDANLKGEKHENRVQILDLHTNNPIISYKGQLYTCAWGSPLGTDVLITAADPSSTDYEEPPTPKATILATTSIKLAGRPIQISPRPPPPQQTPIPAPTDPTTSSTPTPTPAPASPQPTQIPLGPAPSLTRQAQASFLQRIINLKAQKGEKDEVTIYAPKAAAAAAAKSSTATPASIPQDPQSASAHDSNAGRILKKRRGRSGMRSSRGVPSRGVPQAGNRKEGGQEWRERLAEHLNSTVGIAEADEEEGGEGNGGDDGGAGFVGHDDILDPRTGDDPAGDTIANKALAAEGTPVTDTAGQHG